LILNVFTIINTGTHCPAPKLDAPYVDVTNPPPDGFAVGFVGNIGCVIGFEHTGQFLTTCQSVRTWSTSDIPKCTSTYFIFWCNIS